MQYTEMPKYVKNINGGSGKRNVKKGERCRVEELIGNYCTLYSYKRNIFILSVHIKNI